MRRTLILTALGATTLSIGLGAGAMLASANSALPSPTVTAAKGNGDGILLHDGTGMTQMMGSAGMNGGMDGAHDMTLHILVTHADGTTDTLAVAVTGDFHN